MRFTGTEETVNPNAIVTNVVIHDSREHRVKAVDNIIGEYIFADFRLDGAGGEVFSRYRWIQVAVDLLLVKVFNCHGCLIFYLC